MSYVKTATVTHYMTDKIGFAGSQATPDIASIASKLSSASEKTQLLSVRELSGAGEPGWNILKEFLLARREEGANAVDGKAYQVLLKAKSEAVAEFLATYFPNGLVPLPSVQAEDFAKLQKLLAALDFQAADQLTRELMCSLAGLAAVQRKWLYFTEVDGLPIEELQAIDKLWIVYSEGKFGFSIQRAIWLGLGKNWDKMWPKIGWKNDKNWTRYPGQFTWDLTAPRGHLPLSNQLRGVRTMEKLLSHPAWN